MSKIYERNTSVADQIAEKRCSEMQAMCDINASDHVADDPVFISYDCEEACMWLQQTY